jgi:hypothetical protein
MEIKCEIVHEYLDRVTDYIAETGGEPNDVTGYHDYVISMRNNAAYDGNLDILLIAIDCLLLNPELDAPSFATRNVVFDADEMNELLQYIRSVAFPDAPPTDPEIIRNVKFVGGIIFDAEVELPA